MLKSKEWSGKVIDCVLRFALSLALAGAQVFGGYAPLALGMIGASGAGLRGGSALIGAAASLLCTLVVGALTYFVKQTLNDFRKADERNAQKLAEVDKRHAANYKELTQQISDLKSDLPLVYVLREDFIRSMNNVDGKLDKIICSLAEKKGG